VYRDCHLPYRSVLSIYMKHEYHEGPKALNRFEQGMSKLFRTSKESVKDKVIPKLKTSVRKTPTK
jgi:hypothetical protein